MLSLWGEHYYRDLYRRKRLHKMARSLFFVAVLAFVSSAFAFIVKNGAARTLLKVSAVSMKMDIGKAVASLTPALVAAPAFAAVDANSLPLSLEVTFAAYLAVLLGTFLPVTFLITLYSQSEARKAGARGQ